MRELRRMQQQQYTETHTVTYPTTHTATHAATHTATHIATNCNTSGTELQEYAAAAAIAADERLSYLLGTLHEP